MSLRHAALALSLAAVACTERPAPPPIPLPSGPDAGALGCSDSVPCVEGATCLGGRCYARACGLDTCGAGEVCDETRCVAAACAGVRCRYGSCDDGGCPQCSLLEVPLVDGGCQVRRALGQACDAPAGCASGHCVGAICCATECPGPCERCSTAGRCELRAALDPGDPPCAGARCSGESVACGSACGVDAQCSVATACSDAGTCAARLPAGARCTRPRECATGFCTDGFCCDRACDEPCATCSGHDAEARAGTCAPALALSAELQCGPNRCDGQQIGCPARCASDALCAVTHYCASDGGCVVSSPAGTACTRGPECDSRHCGATGFCCPLDCNGSCQQCLSNGTCENDAGLCPAGGPAFCTGGECCLAPSCGVCFRCTGDGGTCVSAPPQTTCGAYLCQSGKVDCPVDCDDTSQDCAPHYRCASSGGPGICTR